MTRLAISGSFYDGRSVLVTGAGGFVGACLAKALVARGATVVALRRRQRAPCALDALGVAHLVRPVVGDVSDGALIERVLDEHQVTSVFHLAAEALVGATEQSPVSTFESNVRGTWMLLEACRGTGIESVVVASSDKAYGHHERLPYEESFALRPKYPYETSKACADLIARCYGETFGVPVSVVRCANTYGGGDLNWSRLVPGTVRAALAGERPVIRSDGSLTRDWVFVDDAIDGYLRLGAAQAADRSLWGEAYNFGSGSPVSVLELTERILRIAGRTNLRPEVQGVGKRLNEISRQSISSSKAQRLLDWRPRVDLDEGLARSIDWYRSYLDPITAEPSATRPTERVA